jgi:hypothetical protein
MTTTPSFPKRNSIGSRSRRRKASFSFLLSREKRERNSRIRAGWMDEKKNGVEESNKRE